MVSTTLFIRSKLLSSNMLTRFCPASRFFWNRSVRDPAPNSSNDVKKKPDRLDPLISYSGVRREDVKLSFGCNIEYVEDQSVEEVDGTSNLEGYVGEYFYSADDATYEIGIEAEMRMDSAELKLDVPKLKGEKRVFNVKSPFFYDMFLCYEILILLVTSLCYFVIRPRNTFYYKKKSPASHRSPFNFLSTLI
ncbi:hypothetical protein Hanom_Chr16g01450191 [Helianthus anomalus]